MMGKRSATMPSPSMSTGPFGSASGSGSGSGSMNPFAPQQQSNSAVSSTNSNAIAEGPRHVSHESKDFVGLGSGRQSPDAFRGLSAKYMR